MESLLLGSLDERSMPHIIAETSSRKATTSRRRARPVFPLSKIDALVSLLQANAIERSTVKAYRTGARDYIYFCTQHNLPLDPTPLTLARYIAYTSRFIASGPKYLSGARHFLNDIFPEFDASRQSAFVQTAIRGSRKIRADSVQRKLPLRLHHLTYFHQSAMISSKYDDYLFATILACGFYGCHRIGELIWNNDRSLWDWRKVIKRSSLCLESHAATYQLPYHKGDPFYRGTVIKHIKHDIVCPVTLLHRYTSLRDRIHGARTALFICENGSHPTRRWFENRFFAVLNHSYGGHSIRSGGATYYASLGLSEDIIQALGRWSSSTWKDYIRENPAVRAELQLARLLHPSN